jgi:hypothetical protein
MQYPGVVQPGPVQRLLYDPRRDRHDPVRTDVHPDCHCGGARARARHDRTVNRHSHPSLGADRGEALALRVPGDLEHAGSAGDRSLVVRCAGARQPDADPAAFGVVPAQQPGDRLAGIDLCQHPARSDADVLDDAASSDLPYRVSSFPLQAMPKLLQYISYLFPLRYYLNIIRGLMLKASSAAMLMEDILALAVFGFFLMAAAALRFRKRLD